MDQDPGSYNVTDDMICNFEQGKETCQGDSGSPVVYDNTLIGVVSWGPEGECGIHPGVNAYVVHCEIRDFIISMIFIFSKEHLVQLFKKNYYDKLFHFFKII